MPLLRFDGNPLAGRGSKPLYKLLDLSTICDQEWTITFPEGPPMVGRGYLERIRLLIVDDNAFSRKLIKSVVQQFGAREIHESENGERAMEDVKSFKPDIIIADWVMSPIDGLEFVHWLRENPNSPAPFTPVIMVSAYSHLSSIMQARDSGINEFLVKPISAKALMMRLQAVIEKPRQFIRTDGYFGPDRRRKDLPHRGPERRADRRADYKDFGEDDDEEIVDLGPGGGV